MAITLNINGTGYQYPEPNDTDWGQDATDWASAVTGGMLQKAGGTFSLTAEVDFGGSFGLKSLYFKSRSPNVAATGQIRLARADEINFRNQANNADLVLGVNSSDQLTFNGLTFSPYIVAISDTATIDLTETSGTLSADVKSDSITNAMINSAAAIAYSKLSLSNSIVNADINSSAAIAYSKLSLTGSIVNADVSASAAIAYSKLALTGSIVNADVNASAAIALTKLAATTASRALVSDGSGFITPATTTATEIGYVNGVTSSIQTQLNAKLNLSGGTMSGVLNMGSQLISSVADPVGPQDAATKAYVDSVAEGLVVKTPVRVATTGPGILVSSYENGDTVDGVVLATGNRILIKDQSVATENGIYIVQASGAPARASDANTWAELVSAFVFVQQGTVNADTGWVCTVDPGGTIGVNNITFVQFSSAGVVLAGNGLTKTGNVLDVNIDNSTIDFTSNNLRVKPLGITNGEISASAGIAYSKLATMTSASILIGNGSNVPTVTAVTGDVTISNAGVTAIASGVIVNADVNASAAIAYSKLALTGSIVNADVGASAAIALSKLAALTTSRALQSNASTGVIEVSSVTNTELGYLSGVTSAIQTQLNAKMTNPMTTGGDVIYGGASGTPTRLANGSSGQVLTSQGGTSAPIWAAAGTPGTQTISGNYTIVSGDAGSVLFVNTGAARNITFPSPSAGFKITIKDSTGQAQTNNITMVRAASEQIEGVAASKILQTNWGSWTFISDGTNWFMI